MGDPNQTTTGNTEATRTINKRSAVRAADKIEAKIKAAQAERADIISKHNALLAGIDAKISAFDEALQDINDTGGD